MLRARLASLTDPGALLDEIFASAPMGLQIFARDGRCVLVNAAHTALFGGVPPPEYCIFTDNLLVERGVVDIVKRAFAGERISTPAIWYDIRELRNLPPGMDVSGGKRIAIASEMVPILEDGQVAYVLIVFNDQTAMHLAREQAEAAAAAAEQRAAQSAFLADAGRMLSSSLDLETTLAQIAELATPALADFCIVDLVDEDGSIRRLAAVHADPSQQGVLDELRAQFPPTPDSPQPAARVIRSHEPELLAFVDTAALTARTMNPKHSALMTRLGIRSHLAVPIHLGARMLGAISLGYVGDRRYSEADVPFVEALASRAAVAIDHARLYRTAEAARADAEAASRAKDEFLAMLGHELRNPLAPIVTALELSTTRSKEHAIIERQVGHLRRLVDDLLDVSRITRGTLELEVEQLDLADAIADGIEAARPLIDQRHQQFDASVSSGMFMHGDRARLAQVITNLLTNAARYTPAGGRITLTASKRGEELVVHVRDNGVGMPADLVPRVFEIFTRGMRSIDRASGGLGLGLAIVKSLTEKHGGRVAARSEGADRGSEFEIVLPALVETAAPVTKAQPASSARTRRGLVLVVDDNVDAATMLAVGLEQRGLTTLVAHDGADALELARAQAPKVAVIDIGMPGMNGYDLAVALHATPGLAKLPIIALTGFGQPADRLRSERAGFASHFVKPVSLETILIALDLFL
ncbi:MAG: response regulator [Deltaproteobacteria bacterium]|nr:response regulator [Deltaproteobacteria bacterium]